MRVYSPEEVEPANRWHLGLLDLVTHADYGEKRIPRLSVIRGQDYLFTTQHYTIEAVDSESFSEETIYFRCLGEFKGTLTMPDGSEEYLHEYVIVK